jgi:adenylate kinase family enzyme
LELKEELRKLGLTGTGCKSELIARLNRSTPSGTWSELQIEAQMSGIMVEAASEGSSHERPECGQERGTRSNPQSREALEMELEMMRRELELLKARSATGSASGTQRTPARTSVETGWVRSEITINTIAELLPEFDGAKGGFCMWRDQLRFLEETYQLNPKHMKILVELRLRGKVLTWLHSSRKHMQLSTEELLRELEPMYDQQADSMTLHEEFRARKWRKDETFSDYMHEKIVLGNRVPIAEKQLLGYIIDGILHWGLRSNVRVNGVSTKEELRARFENVEHWDRKDEAEGDAKRYHPARRTINNVRVLSI